ncbi:alanine racemase [Paenibacillus sp. M1]|uniref:Alanine racemase n=1 Tax=Paenibacillus haidiansis TaxID=1574488 RepID=A0ABU7VM21_9BACL
MKSTNSPDRCRDTRAEISLDAVAHNLRLFRRNAAERCRIMAVVKANGYGHGAAAIARTAIAHGADYLGVAIVDEAVQLRNGGIDTPILVLGHTPPHAVAAAIAQGISLTVFTDEVLQEVMESARRLKRQARIHLKTDTGMGRIGLSSPESVLELALKAASSSYILIEGLFTHFADADGHDRGFTERQFSSFRACIDLLAGHNLSIPIKHCCNSAAAMCYPEMHMDMIRVGIALYGLYPSVNARLPEYPLREAMCLKTSVIDLRQIGDGQTVGYGRTFKATATRMIATVPIGYADGLSRALSNKGHALVRGKRVPIAGRVCMDQTMLDVTEVDGVRTGDAVTLFGGAETGGGIPIDEVATHMNTIPYEVVCLIGQRVPRVYKYSLKPE